MSQERRRHLGSHRFDMVNLEPPVTDGSTALAPVAKKLGILQRWFGSRKKVDIKQKDPQIIEFKQAVAAIGVDLDTEISRPALYQNTNNVRVLPVLMKQAEDVHPYDEEQVERALETFKMANAKLPESERLPISIIADGLVTGNKGKVTDFEGPPMPFQTIPSEADVRKTPDGIFAYQVVSDRVIKLLPSAEVENRLAVITGNQLTVQAENNKDESKALSTVVVIRRNAKPIDQQQVAAKIAEPEEMKSQIEPVKINSQVASSSTSPFLNESPVQITRSDLNEQ